MSKSAKTLYVPSPVSVLRYRARTFTTTNASGERVKVTIDDSGTVRHIERDEGIDAIVRPKTIRLHLKGGLHGTR